MTPSAPRISEDELAEALRMDMEALRVTLPVIEAGSLTTTISVSMLRRMYDSIAARSAPAAGLDEEVIPIRKLVVAWFHDSEEICEHDEPPPSCEIMADHLLAAFSVGVRDWKAYAADNRLSAALAAEEVR